MISIRSDSYKIGIFGMFSVEMFSVGSLLDSD
jgi:hypothetical protein